MPFRFLVLLCHVFTLATVATVAAPSKNALLYWNDQVLNATRLSRNPPPVAALHMATYHVAIFDAVNGITRTHRPWLVGKAAGRSTSRCRHRWSRLHRAHCPLGSVDQPAELPALFWMRHSH